MQYTINMPLVTQLTIQPKYKFKVYDSFRLIIGLVDAIKPFVIGNIFKKNYCNCLLEEDRREPN